MSDTQAIAARLKAIAAERNTSRSNLLAAIKSLAAKAEAHPRAWGPAALKSAQLEAISTFERAVTAELSAHVETLTQQVAELNEALVGKFATLAQVLDPHNPKFEYDQGDFALVHFDDVYDLNDRAVRAEQEIARLAAVWRRDQEQNDRLQQENARLTRRLSDMAQLTKMVDAKLEQAEQHRDAALAALKYSRDVLDRMDKEGGKGSVAHLRMKDAIGQIDAALAASAPQQEEK